MLSLQQTDRQTDTGKTVCPRSIDVGALKDSVHFKLVFNRATLYEKGREGEGVYV